MKKPTLLIDEYPLMVLPSLAKKIGLNEAIVIQQIHYWINNPKGGVIVDGNKWVYNTYEEWQEDNFPFWSVRTIQRIFASLEEVGLVVSMQKAAYDRKKYYRIHYDKLSSWMETDCHNAEFQNGVIEHDKLASSLTETTTKTTTNKEQFLEKADLAWSILAGHDVTEEQVKTIQLRDVAPKKFEQALGFSKPLPWWDGDKVWRELGEWVCQEFDRNKTSFGEYNIWRNTKYTKGGMTNSRLRGFPKEFYDSWDMFLMATKPEHKTDETRPEYQPFPFLDGAS